MTYIPKHRKFSAFYFYIPTKPNIHTFIKAPVLHAVHFWSYAGFRKISYPVSIEGNLCKCKPHLFPEVLLNSCSAVQ